METLDCNLFVEDSDAGEAVFMRPRLDRGRIDEAVAGQQRIRSRRGKGRLLEAVAECSRQ